VYDICTTSITEFNILLVGAVRESGRVYSKCWEYNDRTVLIQKWGSEMREMY
jgi:hypothetical protein